LKGSIRNLALLVSKKRQIPTQLTRIQPKSIAFTPKRIPALPASVEEENQVANSCTGRFRAYFETYFETMKTRAQRHSELDVARLLNYAYLPSPI
jgi:hypothetical protein